MLFSVAVVHINKTCIAKWCQDIGLTFDNKLSPWEFVISGAWPMNTLQQCSSPYLLLLHTHGHKELSGLLGWKTNMLPSVLFSPNCLQYKKKKFWDASCYWMFLLLLAFSLMFAFDAFMHSCRGPCCLSCLFSWFILVYFSRWFFHCFFFHPGMLTNSPEQFA